LHARAARSLQESGFAPANEAAAASRKNSLLVLSGMSFSLYRVKQSVRSECTNQLNETNDCPKANSVSFERQTKKIVSGIQIPKMNLFFLDGRVLSNESLRAPMVHGRAATDGIK
jgi:hypothetical protein